MEAIEKGAGNIVEIIRSKVKILNLTVLLSITAVLLLVAKFMYSFLGYMGTPSILGILITVSILAAAVFYITKTVSHVAIKSIEDYHERLGALMEVCKQVHELEHTDVIMEHILDSALELTGAEGGALLTEEEDLIRFSLVKGSDADVLTGCTFPRTQGVGGWVMSNGKPAIVNDMAKEGSRYGEADRCTGLNPTSLLCVPIKLKDRVIGALELDSSRPGAFSNEDGELVGCFLSQAALSMTEARYKEDMKNYEMHLTNILIEAIENVAEKGGHLKRVAKYSLMIGHALKMNEEGLRTLHRAAMLHDIGFLRMKVMEGMSEKEYNAHALHGYEILRQVNFYRDIATIVLHHHERFDGKGHPEGLSGEDIPLMSRIISIAEVFDVITNKKPFNRMLNSDESFGMLGSVEYTRAIIELQANAGHKFDPNLVETLVKNITEDDVEWNAFESSLQAERKRRRDIRIVA